MYSKVDDHSKLPADEYTICKAHELHKVNRSLVYKLQARLMEATTIKMPLHNSRSSGSVQHTQKAL